MTKKALNQNAKYVQELIKSIEPDFIFNNKVINRIKITTCTNKNKVEKLIKLKKKINIIEK